MADMWNWTTAGLAAGLVLGVAMMGPAAAQSALAGGDTRGSLTVDDDRQVNGRYRDCFILTAEPGSEVALGLRSTAFDAYLIVSAGAACDAEVAALYVNDDAHDGTRDAVLNFRALRPHYLTGVPSYLVVVTSAGADETGSYVLSTRVTPPDRTDPSAPVTLSLPEVVINNLYASDDPFDLAELPSLRRWFSPGLAGALNQLQRRANGLSFDFLADGQDSDLSDFRFSLRSGRGRDYPVVRADFRNFDTPVRLEFEMVAGESQWVIADIRSLGPDGRERWKLSQRLQEELSATRGR